MLAVAIDRFGPPEVLVPAERPDPRPGPGELSIEVELASITFVETQVRAGRPPHPSMAPPLPAILGNGVGGTVREAGVGADPSLVGRRVVSTTGGQGGYAELVSVPAALAIELPDSLPLEQAVALLADGRTAVSLARLAAIAPGERVLVEAAAGGVGSLLVQLAVAAGARVAGIAGDESKRALVRQLGAEVVADARSETWPDDVRAALGAIDVVFDGVGGVVGRRAFELVAPGGRFCPFGMASGAFTVLDPAEAEQRGISVLRGERPSPAATRALSEAALAEAVAGRLVAVIGQTFPLERAADAHRAIEARETRGKTLLWTAARK